MTSNSIYHNEPLIKLFPFLFNFVVGHHNVPCAPELVFVSSSFIPFCHDFLYLVSWVFPFLFISHSHNFNQAIGTPKSLYVYFSTP